MAARQTGHVEIFLHFLQEVFWIETGTRRSATGRLLGLVCSKAVHSWLMDWRKAGLASGEYIDLQCAFRLAVLLMERRYGMNMNMY